ncbi:hypothetical protein CYMTET_27559 [Cymbomonas tetramitiformis]|uniref:Fe2OG dioxygenase domain-containing protein n=1 Tax=Cymbomonas tetramitiformis TaxID=36881 RepID=A0AAE0FPU5_9CHLO|nr:hypothetical protein CYMTET_27559 [Cymbomonas tetramitiformis]
MYQTNLMTLNATHFVKEGSLQLLEKERIWEMDPQSNPAWPEIQSTAPSFSALSYDDHLTRALDANLRGMRFTSQALKLQLNEGRGGSFPLHFDSDRELDGRQVTAIVYLNDGWTAEAGGQLRLYPFPEPPVTIEPLFDRLVLFSSPNMLHRVLPSATRRLCFTVWLSGQRTTVESS